MIGSECAMCGKVIEAGEWFKIITGGVVHSDCERASRSGEVLPTMRPTADHESRSKEGGH